MRMVKKLTSRTVLWILRFQSLYPIIYDSTCDPRCYLWSMYSFIFLNARNVQGFEFFLISCSLADKHNNYSLPIVYDEVLRALALLILTYFYSSGFWGGGVGHSGHVHPPHPPSCTLLHSAILLCSPLSLCNYIHTLVHPLLPFVINS